MKNYFAPEIMSQLSFSHSLYHITPSHSLCNQTKIFYLSNNLNDLEKEQKSNFEEIMAERLVKRVQYQEDLEQGL